MPVIPVLSTCSKFKEKLLQSKKDVFKHRLFGTDHRAFAVWTLILQSEPEGPALISCAARLHRVGCHSYMVASSLRRRGALSSAYRSNGMCANVRVIHASNA